MATLTTQITNEASPQLLRNSIDTRITAVRPMATPVDQISRLAGSRNAGAMEVAYYTIDSKATSTTVASSYDLSMSEFKPEVGRVVKLKVKDGSIFDRTDTVMFPAHPLSKPEGACLTAYISEVAENQLTLSFVDDVELTIASGEEVVRMGRAACELDVQTPQYIVVPRRESNYCQIFKMQVEQSTLMRLADKEVGWTFSEQEEAAVIDMRLGMEKNFVFGRKARLLDPVKNEHVYLTGGIWNQAGRQTDFALADADADSFITLAREVFTGNNGSRKRLLIGGSQFVEAISKMKISDKVIFGQMHSKWGLETREITTNFGSLYILHSEVFDQCGHSKDAMVLDQAFITKFCHVPFRPEKLDLRAAGSRNADAVVLTEASCLVLRNPNVHLRVIGK